MIQYKIIVNDRNYSNWKLYDALSLNEVESLPIDPINERLFSNDVFEYE